MNFDRMIQPPEKTRTMTPGVNSVCKRREVKRVVRADRGESGYAWQCDAYFGGASQALHPLPIRCILQPSSFLHTMRTIHCPARKPHRRLNGEDLGR
jgi:hypothetical protein